MRFLTCTNIHAVFVFRLIIICYTVSQKLSCTQVGRPDRPPGPACPPPWQEAGGHPGHPWKHPRTCPRICRCCSVVRFVCTSGRSFCVMMCHNHFFSLMPTSQCHNDHYYSVTATVNSHKPRKQCNPIL